MQNRLARTGCLIALALLLTLSLGACGDKGGSGGSGGSGATDGADSPQDLVERMRKAGEDEDFGQVIPLMHPDHRGAMTFFIGIFPPMMMVGMAEGMSGMAAMGGPEKEKEAKDKIAAMKKGWEDLLAKYDIDLEGDDQPDAMKMMSPDASLEERREALKGLDKVIGDIDHAAFIEESFAFLESHSDKDKDGGMSETSWEKFDMQDIDIQVDGDTATLTSTDGKDGKDKIGLVKLNGRWYIDMATME